MNEKKLLKQQHKMRKTKTTHGKNNSEKDCTSNYTERANTHYQQSK